MRTPPALACLAVMLCAWAPAVALAQAAPADAASGLDGGLQQQVRQLALSVTHGSTSGGTGGGIGGGIGGDKPGSTQTNAPRIEIEVGQLDPRLRLAPCQQVQPYVPDGMRMWGKSRIGLRCLQGPTKWNVYLAVTVKVFGTALVASSGLAAGSVLTAADLTPAEVDLAEDSSAPVARAELAVGRTLTRVLKPGQGLRQSHLKARQWFAAGETVTVLAQGDGFSVAGEAQALMPGIEGQPVRLRTESGRIVTGQAVGERRVELVL